MVDALRVELDDAIEALRNVHEPESELSRELDARQRRAGRVDEGRRAGAAPAAREPSRWQEPEPEPEPEPGPSEPEPPSPSPPKSPSRPSR